MMIAHFPAKSSNPYISLLYAALERHGISPVRLRVSDLHGLARRTDVNVVHFHWNLEQLWQTRQPGVVKPGAPRFRIARWLDDAGFALDPRRGLTAYERWLRGLKVAGIRIVWTVHELDPPENSSAIDVDGYRILAAHADYLLCHSEHAKQQIIHRWAPTCAVEVMKIGNYDDVYTCTPADRAATLRHFSLDPDRPVVALLGKMRRYKGADMACRAVLESRNEFQLVVAGPVVSREVLSELEAIAQKSCAIRIIARALSTEEYCQLGRACDLFVLPYRSLTASSALIAAFTLGRAVVATDLPYFRETGGSHPEAMRLVSSVAPEVLANGIQTLLRVPADARSRAARGIADAHAWDDVVMPLVDWLKRAVSDQCSGSSHRTLPALTDESSA